MKRALLLTLITLYASSAFAGIERSPTSQIQRITSYYNGDVSIILENNGSSCSGGYWLKVDDIGYSSSISMLLAAYHSGDSINLRGFTDVLWSGSSNAYCHIYAIEYGYK
ncbi:hypothetical protein [Microbulbifer sp. TRSA005]|uniref:hypothetical protein n=1 Tax=unclassified Microbulbifer TaxID=2619833 RepID=UPI00403A367E